MRNHKKSRWPGIVFLVLLLLMTAFIFSRSLHSADLSSLESGNVVVLFSGVLSNLGIGLEQADFIIRKTAHFLEFFVFGILLTCTVKYNSDKKISKNIFLLFFFLLLIPVCDETIQYLSPGRSPEVKDVLLDFCGALTGFAAVFSIDCLFRRLNKKNKGK